jgi:hypothetical protein
MSLDGLDQEGKKELGHHTKWTSAQLNASFLLSFKAAPPPVYIWGCNQKFPDWVYNEINNNKHSLRSNTKGYGGKIHWTDSQNSDITSSCRKLYHLQFSLQAASPETFVYTLMRPLHLVNVRNYLQVSRAINNLIYF